MAKQMKALGLGCNLIKCRIRRSEVLERAKEGPVYPRTYMHGHMPSTDKWSRIMHKAKEI